ncbi:hypothetical protein Cgig2_011726 [Carnegiea gigantea]|uniref:Uncharacterized protein n=1 Tax=Carnegiea gigantea TaxID=171969 RepID=A0A9Q1QK62_9CARY|nr:hypothetical protein Cgig2_011726 [Carnegiea gigantea]
MISVIGTAFFSLASKDGRLSVRSALETLLDSLTPLNNTKPAKIEVEPSKMNANLLSREMDNISLLLGLLASNLLQEAILAIPRGITQPMDMIMDRECPKASAKASRTDETGSLKAYQITDSLIMQYPSDKINRARKKLPTLTHKLAAASSSRTPKPGPTALANAFKHLAADILTISALSLTPNCVISRNASVYAAVAARPPQPSRSF